MVPTPIPPKNTPPISTSTHQIIEENNLSPPLHLSIPQTKRKERRQTQTLEQRFEESLELEAVSDISYAASRAKTKRGVVRLRLARFGRKNAPFYRIHAADSRCRRDGKFLERIGYYDPRPGMMTFSLSLKELTCTPRFSSSFLCLSGWRIRLYHLTLYFLEELNNRNTLSR